MLKILRTLLRKPGISVVVVVSLAVGIGANTLIFSWLKASVFNPLPKVTASVSLLESKDEAGNYLGTSWLEYKDLRELLPSFESLAAHRSRALYLGDSENGKHVFSELVSENFFNLLGIKPQRGRFFSGDEATRVGSAPVAVISDRFWKTNYKGSSDAIGQNLKLNGRTFTIIGVTPEGFCGAMNNLVFDVWVPLTMAGELVPASSELSSRNNRAYGMLARLAPDVMLSRAQGELATAARQLVAMHPTTNKGIGYVLLPVWRSPRGGETLVLALATLQAFAVLILIVVCANTASLLLAHSSTRQREIGVKLAIGAGPSVIVSQLLAESVALALVGSGAGLMFAKWGIHALSLMSLPGNLPVRLAPPLDWPSLLFAVALGVTCGLVFGIAPAWQLARSDVLHALRGGRGEIGGRNRLRDMLVGVEVGVAVVALVLAGLFWKSFSLNQDTWPGFDRDRVMLASVDLGVRGYNGQTGAALLDDLLQKLGATPGIERAAAASFVPLDLRGTNAAVISIPGQDYDPRRQIGYYYVSDGYFTTMGIPFTEGADIAPLRSGPVPLDAVINTEMAKRYWQGGSPIGHQFEVDGTAYTITGVVRDIRLEKLNEGPRPSAWLTMRKQFVSIPTLHVRARASEIRSLIPVIGTMVRQRDPELVVFDTRTLSQHIESNLFTQRAPAQMLAWLGLLALALAAIGLYAVLAYSVAQRRQEIGVRLTLGATPRSVVGLMMWQSLRVVLFAVAAGLAVALCVSWFLKSFFVGVSYYDPLVYAGVPMVLLIVATLASWLPARAAAGVDPLVALRAE